MSADVNNDRAISLREALSNGLMPDGNFPYSSQYLLECYNFLPSDRGLLRPLQPDSYLRTSGSTPLDFAVDANFNLTSSGKFFVRFFEVSDALYFTYNGNIYQVDNSNDTYSAITGTDLGAGFINGLNHLVSYAVNGSYAFVTNSGVYAMRLNNIQTQSGKQWYGSASPRYPTYISACEFINDRLVLGGVLTDADPNNRLRDMFEKWRIQPKREVVDDTAIQQITAGTSTNDWCVISPPAGGDIDLPYVSFLAGMNLFSSSVVSDTTYNDVYKPVIYSMIEQGLIEFFRCKHTGRILEMKRFQNGLLVYGDRGVSYLTRDENGWNEIRISDIGALYASGVYGDIEESIYLTKAGLVAVGRAVDRFKWGFVSFNAIPTKVIRYNQYFDYSDFYLINTGFLPGTYYVSSRDNFFTMFISQTGVGILKAKSYGFEIFKGKNYGYFKWKPDETSGGNQYVYHTFKIQYFTPGRDIWNLGSVDIITEKQSLEHKLLISSVLTYSGAQKDFPEFTIDPRGRANVNVAGWAISVGGKFKSQLVDTPSGQTLRKEPQGLYRVSDVILYPSPTYGMRKWIT